MAAAVPRCLRCRPRRRAACSRRSHQPPSWLPCQLRPTGVCAGKLTVEQVRRRKNTRPLEGGGAGGWWGGAKRQPTSRPQRTECRESCESSFGVATCITHWRIWSANSSGTGLYGATSVLFQSFFTSTWFCLEKLTAQSSMEYCIERSLAVMDMFSVGPVATIVMLPTRRYSSVSKRPYRTQVAPTLMFRFDAISN